MLNDMVRVSLEAYFTKTTGLFICVADYKMLGHQIKRKIVDRFPSDYRITNVIINHQLKQRTNNFDKRFLNVFLPMNTIINSRSIYNEKLEASNIKKETKLIIWEVSLSNLEISP